MQKKSSIWSSGTTSITLNVHKATREKVKKFSPFLNTKVCKKKLQHLQFCFQISLQIKIRQIKHFLKTLFKTIFLKPYKCFLRGKIRQTCEDLLPIQPHLGVPVATQTISRKVALKNLKVVPLYMIFFRNL